MEEAFLELSRRLETLTVTDPETVNITQALAETRHGKAKQLLLGNLEELWKLPLWDESHDSRKVAGAVIFQILNLLDLGCAPEDFEEKVQALNASPWHRAKCRLHLAKHYNWIVS
jgi:hypothetical protein